jgi:hypothetical protein
MNTRCLPRSKGYSDRSTIFISDTPLIDFYDENTIPLIFGIASLSEKHHKTKEFPLKMGILNMTVAIYARS